MKKMKKLFLRLMIITFMISLTTMVSAQLINYEEDEESDCQGDCLVNIDGEYILTDASFTKMYTDYIELSFYFSEPGDRSKEDVLEDNRLKKNFLDNIINNYLLKDLCIKKNIVIEKDLSLYAEAQMNKIKKDYITQLYVKKIIIPEIEESITDSVIREYIKDKKDDEEFKKKLPNSLQEQKDFVRDILVKEKYEVKMAEVLSILRGKYKIEYADYEEGNVKQLFEGTGPIVTVKNVKDKVIYQMTKDEFNNYYSRIIGIQLLQLTEEQKLEANLEEVYSPESKLAFLDSDIDSSLIFLDALRKKLFDVAELEINLERYKEQIEQQLLQTIFMTKIVLPKVEVTEEDIVKFIEQLQKNTYEDNEDLKKYKEEFMKYSEEDQKTIAENEVRREKSAMDFRRTIDREWKRHIILFNEDLLFSSDEY